MAGFIFYRQFFFLCEQIDQAIGTSTSSLLLFSSDSIDRLILYFSSGFFREGAVLFFSQFFLLAADL